MIKAEITWRYVCCRRSLIYSEWSFTVSSVTSFQLSWTFSSVPFPFLQMPFSLCIYPTISLYPPHPRQPLLLPHPHLSHKASRNCIWCKEWRDVGDADIRSGRKEAWKQGRSCLHRSSPEEKTGTWMLRGGGGGGAERGGDRKERGRVRGGNEREWASTQHSHQLSSIHHSTPPKGCRCFIGISSLSSVCARVCVCTHMCTFTGKFMNIYFQKNEYIDAAWVFVLHWAAFSPLYNLV